MNANKHFNAINPPYRGFWTRELAAVYDDRVERAIGLLESSKTDITETYRDWESIGLAFSFEYQEKGREYFHRVSQFYPGYSREDCDQKYNLCLERARGSYDLIDFLKMVEAAGFSRMEFYSLEDRAKVYEQQQQSTREFLEVLKEVQKEMGSGDYQPGGFQEEVYKELPDFLQQVLAPAKGEHEKGVMLLGALGVLSSALPGFYGIYDSLIRPNLYLFVSAPPASGKGILNYNRYLVTPLQRAKEAS